MLCAAAVLLAVVLLRYFGARWFAHASADLRVASRVVKTRAGEIEYATGLSGSPVLISHGTLGGFDQGLVAADLILTSQFRPIAISRPGYLRTPLAAGATPEQQADAFAALLDSLAIDRLPVIGISGGGPPALQFALRHPRRCTALVLVCALTRKLVLPGRATVGLRIPRLVTSPTGNWIVSRFYSHFTPPISMAAFSRYERGSRPANWQLRDALRLMATSLPVQPRLDGVRNDAQYISTLAEYPLKDIQQPTLIIHGDEDEVVPFSQAEFAAEQIPSSKLLRLEHGSHFAAFVRSEEIRAAIADFLK